MSRKRQESHSEGAVPRVSRRALLRGALVAGASTLTQPGSAAGQTALPTLLPQIPPETEHFSLLSFARIPHRKRPHPRTPAAVRNETSVHLNQIGYLVNEPKRAVVPSIASIVGNAFQVIDDDITLKIRYSGVLTEYLNPSVHDYDAVHRYFYADFDAFQEPGRYRVRLSDGRLSDPFSISNDAFTRLIPIVLQFFDMQTCGMDRPGLHGLCHTDDGEIANGPRKGRPIDAAGGWHDAGDYLKFVETTSYVAALMLTACDRLPQVFLAGGPTQGLPELLRYAKVGVDWLLKMHPSPDEFYYQVGDGDADHNVWRLPEHDMPEHNPGWRPRPVFAGIGANLAGRTAAAFALASRLFRPYDDAYAQRCLGAARSVYQLGLRNRRVLTTNPADYYPEITWQDDMAWGAAALFEATKEPGYLTQGLLFAHRAGAANYPTSVYNTHVFAFDTLFPHADAADRDWLLSFMRDDAEKVRGYAETNPYALGTPYIWGTAEAAAGAALNSLLFAQRCGEREAGPHFALARRQRDFILGCNPFNLSCLVGAGSRYALFPHHQVANIRNVPLMGAIIGGPAEYSIFVKEHIDLKQVEFSTQTPSPPPFVDQPGRVGVYHDVVEDYVTNEPANDYTAKFLLLAGFYHSV